MTTQWQRLPVSSFLFTSSRAADSNNRSGVCFWSKMSGGFNGADAEGDAEGDGDLVPIITKRKTPARASYAHPAPVQHTAVKCPQFMNFFVPTTGDVLDS